MADVLEMPAKSRHGGGKNYKWFITYNRNTRKFAWRVEFTVNSVVSGEAATDAEAYTAVQEHIQRIKQ